MRKYDWKQEVQGAKSLANENSARGYHDMFMYWGGWADGVRAIGEKVIDKFTEWTPVDKALPDKSDTFLVTTRFPGGGTYRTLAEFHAGGYVEGACEGTPFWWSAESYELDVIAWMPIPEIYEGENENE